LSPWRSPKYQIDPKIEAKEKTLQEQTAILHKSFEQKYQTAKSQLDTLKDRCIANEYDAIRLLINLSHARHELPSVLRRFWEVDMDQTSRILLCTFELPDFSSLTISKSRSNSWKSVPVTTTERKRSNETIIYSLCLRAAYLAAQSDARSWFDTIAINATRKWNDAATGQPREGIIASLQAQKSEIAQYIYTK
jgi:hypothetical protein